jgi:hypothetical protein
VGVSRGVRAPGFVGGRTGNTGSAGEAGRTRPACHGHGRSVARHRRRGVTEATRRKGSLAGGAQSTTVPRAGRGKRRRVHHPAAAAVGRVSVPAQGPRAIHDGARRKDAVCWAWATGGRCAGSGSGAVGAGIHDRATLVHRLLPACAGLGGGVDGRAGDRRASPAGKWVCASILPLLPRRANLMVWAGDITTPGRGGRPLCG